MKLTAYDKGMSPAERFDEIVGDQSTLRQKCVAAGLSTSCGCQWRRRHPDSTLSDDEVVALILKNKREQAEQMARNAQRQEEAA